jgi:hypothetical protein
VVLARRAHGVSDPVEVEPVQQGVDRPTGRS